MKPIAAKKQVVLGPMRCVQLALTGMSYRMGRSLITIAILGLAVAFLVHMLAYGLLSQATQQAAESELSVDRRSGELVTRLTTPDAAATVLETLARDDREARLTEYRGWATANGVDEGTFGRAVVAAHEMQDLRDYLQTLPAASQAALMGDLDTPALLERLRDGQRYNRFKQTVDDLSVPPPLGAWPDFAGLVRERWPAAQRVAAAATAGHADALAAVRSAYPDRSPQELFLNPSDSLGQTLRDAGFAFDDASTERVAGFVGRSRDLQALTRLVTSNDPIRQALARRLGVAKAEVTFEQVIDEVDSPGGAAWLAERLAEQNVDPPLSADRVLELALDRQRQDRLESAVGEGIEEPGPFMGLPVSTLYLIGLSFLVCVVGVANAMLMSVTERFTEIATMKCLGAMDRFVMMMFVFEAAIQGVIGGIGGIVLGIALALLRGFVDFGTLLVNAASAAGMIAIAAALSLAVGMLLATLAAVGPSWIASRLAPMEAMRVE